MTPKAAAEAYILRTIGELDAATEGRILSELNRLGAPYASVDKFLDNYEAEVSITEALVQWIKDEWAATEASVPKQSAKQFAKSKVEIFLETIG